MASAAATTPAPLSAAINRETAAALVIIDGPKLAIFWKTNVGDVWNLTGCPGSELRLQFRNDLGRTIAHEPDVDTGMLRLERIDGLLRAGVRLACIENDLAALGERWCSGRGQNLSTSFEHGNFW